MLVEDLESKRILTVCACMKRELYSVTAENSGTWLFNINKIVNNNIIVGKSPPDRKHEMD